MQPTVASSSREQEAALSKGKSRATKRALARRNDLLEDILPYLDLILEVWIAHLKDSGFRLVAYRPGEKNVRVRNED